MPSDDVPDKQLGPGRPSRQTEAPVTWSIRGVSRETRSAMEQAAARAGKTLGEYFNENLRALAERELAQTALAPSDAVNLQDEIHYLRRLVENLTSMIAGYSPAEPPALSRGPKC